MLLECCGNTVGMLWEKFRDSDLTEVEWHGGREVVEARDF